MAIALTATTAGVESAIATSAESDYIELRADMTVDEAFAYMQTVGDKVDNFYTCYVLDSEQRLIGIVSARDLLLSDETRLVGEIMEPVVISAHTGDDPEDMMSDIRKYGFMTIPIVDDDGRMVSVFTFDEAFTVQEDEATEDFEKMAAISPSEAPYLQSSVLTLAKHRIPWLIMLMVFASITAVLVEYFEDSLAVLPALVAFVPMLMNTGGNAGTQSSTMIIRGMALGDIDLHDFLKVMAKEMLVSLVCGVALIIVTYISVIIFGEGPIFAVTVCVAMVATIIMSNIIGGSLTFLAKAVKVDPAVMAAPLLTNFIDALALLVYFSLARVILGI